MGPREEPGVERGTNERGFLPVLRGVGGEGRMPRISSYILGGRKCGGIDGKGVLLGCEESKFKGKKLPRKGGKRKEVFVASTRWGHKVLASRWGGELLCREAILGRGIGVWGGRKIKWVEREKMEYGKNTEFRERGKCTWGLRVKRGG